jgi:ElaB/YqjD/DUF883 family membrane-anchored ribosome-binding protein
MNSPSTAASEFRDQEKAAGETGREGGTLERDLQALRQDFARLADQVADILADAGNAAWQHARSNIDEAVSGVEDKGREAASAVREVSGHFVDALDQSLKTRPYTTLALAAGIAFVLGITWRR